MARAAATHLHTAASNSGSRLLGDWKRHHDGYGWMQNGGTEPCSLVAVATGVTRLD